MAHFAKIENNEVVNVIVLNDNDCGGGIFPQSEIAGQQFIASIGLDGEWVQTSYNRNFRGQYAGIGMGWNGEVFHHAQPYPSWVLDSDGLWNPPIPSPREENKEYSWDEGSASWVLTNP